MTLACINNKFDMLVIHACSVTQCKTHYHLYTFRNRMFSYNLEHSTFEQ